MTTALFRMISVYNAKRALTATALIIAISGCASQVERLPILYKPEIRQGTLITEVGITQLEMGMTPSQVRFLLGPPTLEDPFSDNRWDYVYEVEPRSADVEAVSRRLSVFFDNGVLAGARGSFIDPDSALHQAAPPLDAAAR